MKASPIKMTNPIVHYRLLPPHPMTVSSLGKKVLSFYYGIFIESSHWSCRLDKASPIKMKKSKLDHCLLPPHPLMASIFELIDFLLLIDFLKFCYLKLENHAIVVGKLRNEEL